MYVLRKKAESFPFIRKTFALFTNRLNDAPLGLMAQEQGALIGSRLIFGWHFPPRVAQTKAKSQRYLSVKGTE
jgi:hypothetical protein